MNRNYHAIILGGGAAGLLCAITAKRKNPAMSVAILEKNDRVGKKLLATGNGRCNLTNDRVSADRYVGCTDEMQPVFDACGTKKLLAVFRELGLLTEKDAEGRWYPLCRQAAAVLDVLRFQCASLGVEVFCGETVKSIRRRGPFVITAESGVFTAEKLVIAAGSKAAPKLGGSSSAADILKNLGHRFTPFAPALCPIRVRSELLKSLKGLRARAEVALQGAHGIVASERGEVQFTEDALSGICVFNLSLHTARGERLLVDLLPDISEKELYILLKKNKERFAQQTADNLLTGILQKRVALAVLKTARIGDLSRPIAQLSDRELRAAAASKRLCFDILGNAGFDRAQACTGGADGRQIDARTMRSRVCADLCLCGEAIDICGECGGYNLHFAFASGMIAGENL